MILSLYITPKNIILPLKGSTKEELLEVLVNRLAELKGLKNPKRLLQTILDREAEGSTFLPTGVAIPHARVPDVDEIVLVTGVVPEGFRETPESDLTHVVILFFSPIKEKEFGKHLKLLAKISAIFHDPEFAHHISAISSPEEIFSLIQHKERETIGE